MQAGLLTVGYSSSTDEEGEEEGEAQEGGAGTRAQGPEEAEEKSGDASESDDSSVRQPFLPRPILPRFPVLARACLRCLGAPILVLTSPRA